MLPQTLVVEFWHTVESELRDRHELSQADRSSAISQYRAALDRHGVGEVIYNRNPEKIADTIAAGRSKGFPEPALSGN